MNVRSCILSVAYCLSLVLLLGAVTAHAQLTNEYYVADQLLKRQRYEDAYRIFKRLHEANPGSYIYMEKATECLINLKRYEEAISLAEKSVEGGFFPGSARIRLGEIHHIKGDTTHAYQLWEETVEQHSGNLQIYIQVARSLRERRAFDRAISIFEKAEKRFNNTTLLSSEMAGTYLMAGAYDRAIREFLDMVKEHPKRIDFVQTSLIRYKDNYLYDTAILEISDFLDELHRDHPAYHSMHQLQLWLLMERTLYDRALATARNYEERTTSPTFSLYSLGPRLLSHQQFDLAEQAYRYYIENNVASVKYQSMEELARVYIEWAEYLSDFNLAYYHKRDSLFQAASTTLEELNRQAPFYDQMGRVLIMQAELALDHMHDIDLARKYLGELDSRENNISAAQRAYVDGRIKLYNREFDLARIAFTRSNKQERLGELADKTRYFLALTDFYAGDYEFAKIQLNALERQTTSNYANDAVELRAWIQKGMNSDSTGSILEPFADAVEHFQKGKDREALATLLPLLTADQYYPLAEEALLELGRNIKPNMLQPVYSLISGYLGRWGKHSPLRERLMWVRARIADQVITKNSAIKNRAAVPASPESGTAEDRPIDASSTLEVVPLPSGTEKLIKLYEDILLEFPQGFYASFARQRIQELEEIQT
ncbi:MAG: hypothetical protein R3211_10675 [Balneolaceae bacterium]|nr:hypothetical protein [Balneolaceae bacterium]